MNDDRLEAELKRRANAVSPRPDWMQRDLLPAVWREIDARPQPVIASRWSPLAGLATLVVALLVMVVAVPRLAPGPLTTPEPTFPVLTTANFAARLAAGELRGRSVLVDGRVSADPAQVGYCVPFHHCYFGMLEGTEPAVTVFVVDVATLQGDANASMRGLASWPYWRAFRAPVDGTLLLSVDDAGGVEYLGRARVNDAGFPTWSVAAAQGLDVDSVDPDEAILVDGWLVHTEPPGTEVFIDCVPRQFPDLDDLPTRYCQPTDYLSSEQPTDLGAPDSAVPLPVQRAAAKQFGGRDANGPAVYAIAPRLYGGGCASAPPCWQWNVVARVDMMTDAPVATPTPLPVTFQCQRRASRPITVLDDTGLVAACRTLEGQIFEPRQPKVTNPDGDLARLRIMWGTSGCVTSATVHLVGATLPHVVAISESMPDPSCSGPPITLGIELDLLGAVDASSIVFREEAEPPVTPSPTPVPSPSPTTNVIECAPLPDSEFLAPYGPATVYDATGLVVSCEMTRPTALPEDGPLANAGGDLRTLVVRWWGSPCDARSDLVFARSVEGGYTLEGRLIARVCRESLVNHEARIHLSSDISASEVHHWWTAAPAPEPTPSPREPGSRILNCAASDPSFDPGVTLVDHSGRIGACSMAGADTVPEDRVAISTTRLPLQLAVDWVVNTGCPGDFSMEFWGPVDEPLGPEEYVLRIARTELNGATCSDVSTVRRVELGFTEPVGPTDIRAFVADEFAFANSNSSQGSATTAEGSFDLLLVAPLNDFQANEPIDLTAELAYDGTADSVTLSGHWLPAISFQSLTGGPILYPYGSILLCPDQEVELRRGVGLQAHFTRPDSPASGDPNNAYYDQFMYDGQFRLPAGTYLISTAVSFSLGSNCTGDHVVLRTAIVIHVR